MKKQKGEVSPESSGVGRNAVRAEFYPKGKIVPAATLGLMKLGSGLQDMNRFHLESPGHRGPQRA